MIEFQVACLAGDRSKPNEDSFVVLPGFVAVLDGVSRPDGTETGCHHDPAWYAKRLAANLAASYLADLGADLSDILAQAIGTVREEHGEACDLDHPGTPQSTVAALRVGPEWCDYLVLCDSTIVLDQGGRLDRVTDRRMLNSAQHLRELAIAGAAPIGSVEQTRRSRALSLAKREYANRPGGYWIAAADPTAAQHAIKGSLPLFGPQSLTRAALLTDGASVAVDQYHLTDWPGLLDLAHSNGPRHVIDLVRQAERDDPHGHRRRRLKQHDDATMAYCILDPEVPQ